MKNKRTFCKPLQTINLTSSEPLLRTDSYNSDKGMPLQAPLQIQEYIEIAKRQPDYVSHNTVDSLKPVLP